ncbi:outer surface protein [Bacillus cereus]|uniref:outer surface protein n=1 Tax=Bacillus TaxID=1386 RepID=UPI000BF62C27|nr:MULTISPECIES: outer surface protein [Bacillus]MBR9673810.1 outer surface protein [Bacillus cereus]PER79972.1 outer surface protein [Bacillus cereus]
MKITKEKVIGVIVLIAVCIPFTAWKESKVNDFPVSIFSKEADGEYGQKLKYTAFLPDVAIWMNGWEKKWTEGERTVYQKGNRIVNVFHPPGDDGFYLLEARENK